MDEREGPGVRVLGYVEGVPLVGPGRVPSVWAVDVRVEAVMEEFHPGGVRGRGAEVRRESGEDFSSPPVSFG